jgi:hypothetical protein
MSKPCLLWETWLRLPSCPHTPHMLFLPAQMWSDWWHPKVCLPNSQVHPQVTVDKTKLTLNFLFKPFIEVQCAFIISEQFSKFSQTKHNHAAASSSSYRTWQLLSLVSCSPNRTITVLRSSLTVCRRRVLIKVVLTFRQINFYILFIFNWQIIILHVYGEHKIEGKSWWKHHQKSFLKWSQGHPGNRMHTQLHRPQRSTGPQTVLDYSQPPDHRQVLQWAQNSGCKSRGCGVLVWWALSLNAYTLFFFFHQSQSLWSFSTVDRNLYRDSSCFAVTQHWWHRAAWMSISWLEFPKIPNKLFPPLQFLNLNQSTNTMWSFDPGLHDRNI